MNGKQAVILPVVMTMNSATAARCTVFLEIMAASTSPWHFPQEG